MTRRNYPRLLRGGGSRSDFLSQPLVFISQGACLSLSGGSRLLLEPVLASFVLSLTGL